jgi:hypothetical protein
VREKNRGESSTWAFDLMEKFSSVHVRPESQYKTYVFIRSFMVNSTGADDENEEQESINNHFTLFMPPDNSFKKKRKGS